MTTPYKAREIAYRLAMKCAAGKYNAALVHLLVSASLSRRVPPLDGPPVPSNLDADAKIMATLPTKNIYKDLITNDAHIFNDQRSPIERDEPRKIFLEVFVCDLLAHAPGASCCGASIH
jgi:hypothetical protein